MKYLKPIGILLLISFSIIACQEEDDDTSTPATSNNNNGTTKTELPSTLKGTEISLKFTAAQTGSPYTENQLLKFKFSQNGQLEIDENPAANDGYEVTISSYTYASNEYRWSNTATNLDYRLSLKMDSSINEINVFNTSTGNFLGQLIESNSSGGGSGNSNQLTITGDTSRIGGQFFNPASGVECTSCTTSERITWTETVSGSADKVFKIELYNNGTIIIDFSKSSAFATSNTSLSAMGISRDTVQKTFTFTNTVMNERFSQGGVITLNGTLSY